MLYYRVCRKHSKVQNVIQLYLVDPYLINTEVSSIFVVVIIIFRVAIRHNYNIFYICNSDQSSLVDDQHLTGNMQFLLVEYC